METVEQNQEQQKGDNDVYKVLYDYAAKHEDELTLVKGTNIKVLSKDIKISGDEGKYRY